MLVVSNTSPLRYLVAVGHDELLAKLFGEISIPTGVFQELADPGAPLPVRQWIAKPPTWLRVHSLLSLPDPD
jgi:predicted nucleic acid-binding protein